MAKRFNMLALIVLLVFQTMITPVAATAQGIVEQDDSNTQTSEIQDLDVDGLEEDEGLENEEVEVGGEELSEEPEEASSENEGEPKEESATDETVEEKSEGIAENEGEENAPENQTITTFAAEDLGNIFTFEAFQKDEQDIEDGAEIEFNTQYQLQYAWETEDIDVKAGNTATLQLPDVFKHWTNAPDQDIVAGGTVVGTYSINNGVLTFTFNENIEGASVKNGFVGLNLEFNEEKFLEEWEHEIDFDGDGEKDLTVIVIPSEVETSLDKEGHTDSDRDAREITWAVDFTNGSDEDIANGVLTDILPDGLGEARDFVVKELSFDFDGNKSVGGEVAFNEPKVSGNEFEMTFDNVPARGGYRVEYTTAITDYTISEFTNAATFAYDNETLPAETTVYSGERSNPIQKEGTYNWGTGQIDWTIIVNENGMDIANAIVHDELPKEQTLVPDSIKVTRNWQDTDFEADGFPITLGSVSSDEVYRINFSTDIDWSKVNGGEYQHYNEFMNETKLTDGENPIGEDNAKVEHWRSSLIEKFGNANDYNYEDKVLSWKIDVNKAKHPINDAVLTDILPAGLETMTFEDITIEGAEVDSEDVTITRNDDGTQTVVINLGNIDDEVTVSYQTEVEDFQENNFKNEASLGGDGIGEETPKDDATVHPPANAFNKDFRGIDYNERTIDWRISVNPHREAITELKIEDTFSNNGMILLPETITVSVDGQELVEDTDYTLTPNTDDEGTGYHKGFTIELLNIDQDNPLNDQLIVDFKTSYDPQLEVDGDVLDPHEGDPTFYVNHANFTGKTVNGNDFDRNDEAETRVREDSWNSGKKEGQLVDFDEDGTERKIAWQVYTNYQQQNLGKGVSVTDTLDYEGTIDEDSIVVSVYEVDKDGNTTITDQTINDYSVEVDGKEFTLTFDEEFEVDERYVIEFTTTVPDISEKSYTNNAMLKVGENEYPYTATVNYDRWDDFLDKQALGYSGNDDVFIGEELKWEVTVNESLSIIKNATIKDTISAGLTYVEGSLKIATQSGTELVEDSDYTLGVSKTGDGETVLDIAFTNDITEALTLNYKTVVTAENGQAVNNKIELNGDGVENKSKETSSLTAKQFSWVGGEYNPNRGALQVKKVDSNSGEVIESGEATFELYYELNGERVQFGEEFTTVNGILDVGNLPLRTYYLTEVEAPDGYILSEEEIEIVVDKTFNNNDENIIEVPFENVKKIDITVEKIWNDEEDQAGFRPDTITVYLHSGENEDPIDSTELNIENSWEASFTDLPEVDKDGNEIVYTIEEVKVPNYESEVVADEDNPNHFIVTNTHEPELINLEGTKTWDDADNQDGVRPNTITVNLLADGIKVDDVEVTEATDWTFEFTDLPKFENGEEINYTIQEIDVEDYSAEITGMDITNSYTPEQTSINVIKHWEDADNQDGIRPESVTVKLLANGEETGKTVELNETNNWQADFTGLDVYADGEKVEYTIKEVAVEGYEVVQTGTSEDGYVLTNIHEPELINLEGTKTWEDANNQDGKRPESITVRLLANGEEIDDVEVTAENEWSYAFTDLPKFENGEEINYTVQEDGVEDYSTEINGFDITNSYTPEQTSINVVKAWEDANNQDGIRPDSVTVKLLADGEETGKEEVLNANNNWQADFTELDVYANGEEIVYTVEEVAVEGYETVISGTPEDGYAITNNYTPEVVDVKGTKTWDDANNQDGKRPESITVRLLANGTEVDSVEVTEEDEWKYSFTDLPKFENGEEITYTVQENQVEDYSTEIDGFNITNSYTPGKTSVNVLKVWEDAENQHDKRPGSIEVVLLADGEATDQTLVLNETNNWQGDFSELDEYKDGQQIKYTIEEVAVDEYRTEITGDSETGFVITNTLKTYAIGDYTWIDSNNDGIQDEDEEVLPGVIVELYDESGENKLAETTTDENGLYIFDELPAGKYTVKFTLTEEQAEKYVFTKQNADENSTKDSDADPETGWTKVIELNDENEHLTKEYTDQDFEATEGIDPTWDAGVVLKSTPMEPAKTRVAVKKVWVGKAEDKVTINLFADGEKVDTVELSEENDWKHTFTDLPTVHNITDEKAIEYTVEEVTVDGYNTEITGDAKEGFTVTNTRKSYAIGDYTWIDSNGDGIQDENEPVLPGVIVELYDEEGNLVAETETDENGLYIFDELEAGNYKVKFTLTEEQAKIYEFTKQNSGEDTAVDSDADPETGWTIEITLDDNNEYLTKDYEDQEVKATEGIDPTWDAGVVLKSTPMEPAKTKVSVEKVWKGEAQDKVTINLLADGKIVDSVELSEENDWKHTFTDLPTVYEITDEKTIEYTIEEEAVEGYRASITGDAKEGFTITNTQKTYAVGDYTWIDSNKDGIQDEDEEVLPGVKVELFDEDGNKIAETETDENGFYIFDELPAGKYKVKFTLTEEQAEKYEFTKQNAGDDSTVDSDADENGWTIEFTLDDENEYLTKDYTDQDFKATEGIDPTWDAGVIVKITPEDPEEPELGGDGGDKEKDPEDSTEVDGDGGEVGETSEEGNLPKTATNIYNLTLIGFGLMLLGLILFLTRRKRIE